MVQQKEYYAFISYKREDEKLTNWFYNKNTRGNKRWNRQNMMFL